jgi:hypothetical protein
MEGGQAIGSLLLGEGLLLARRDELAEANALNPGIMVLQAEPLDVDAELLVADLLAGGEEAGGASQQGDVRAQVRRDPVLGDLDLVLEAGGVPAPGRHEEEGRAGRRKQKRGGQDGERCQGQASGEGRRSHVERDVGRGKKRSGPPLHHPPRMQKGRPAAHYPTPLRSGLL